jgi:hypothetical protein
LAFMSPEKMNNMPTSSRAVFKKVFFMVWVVRLRGDLQLFLSVQKLRS